MASNAENASIWWRHHVIKDAKWLARHKRYVICRLYNDCFSRKYFHQHNIVIGSMICLFYQFLYAIFNIRETWRLPWMFRNYRVHDWELWSIFKKTNKLLILILCVYLCGFGAVQFNRIFRVAPLALGQPYNCLDLNKFKLPTHTHTHTHSIALGWHCIIYQFRQFI